ncbi:MAG: PAS domain S-box protein, partial [Armatimonadota bacterium]
MAAEPLGAFRLLEANQHRIGYATLSQFLGIVKCYRHAYIDLVAEFDLSGLDKDLSGLGLHRFYDGVELSVCSQWTAGESKRLGEQFQGTHRLLTAEEDKFRSLFVTGEIAVVLLDTDNRISNLNDAAFDVLPIGRTANNDYRQVDLQQAMPWLTAERIATAAQGRSDTTLTVSLQMPRGRRNFDVRLSRMVNDSEIPIGVSVALADVTDAEAQVTEITRLNRLLATLSAVNKAGVQATEQQALLDEVCKICVERGGFRLAAICLLDPEPSNLKVTAHHGHEEGYLIWVGGDLAAAGDDRDPSGDVIRSGEHWVVQDIASSSETAAWREEALKRGYKSFGAFPIRCEGEVVGCISLYSKDVGFTAEDELAILQEMAGNVSFIMEILKHEQDRKLLAIEMETSTERYRSLHESLPGGIVLVDRTLAIIEANPAAREILGFEPEGADAHALLPEVWRAIHEDGTPFLGDAHPAAMTILTGKAIRGVVMGLLGRTDGETIWLLVNSEPLRDRDAGEVVAAVVNFLDITQRKIHEQRHESLLQTAMDGFWLVDVQGRLLEVNETYCRMSGYGEQELLAMSILDLEATETLADTTAHLQTIKTQ